jgi:hypothetical protein
VKFGLDDFKRYFREVATFPIVPPDITGDPAEYLVSSGLACIGTPDDCVRHFERLWKGSNGGFGGVLLLAHNWADWPATKRSYELMARYVHPHSSATSATSCATGATRCQGEIRDRRPPVAGRGPGRNRALTCSNPGHESTRRGNSASEATTRSGAPGSRSGRCP